MTQTHAKTGPDGLALPLVLKEYGVPDPKIVGKLPKGGTTLDFVGHADVTKMLIEIDPCWTWEPVAFDNDGLPAYRVENGMAHMAGWLIIHGVRRLGVGSVQHNKPDIVKELVSDFLRNAAMRFGVCLALWTKQEWDDIPRPAAEPSAVAKPGKQTIGNRPQDAKGDKPAAGPTTPLTAEQVAQFETACEKAGIDMEEVVVTAGIGDRPLVQADLATLRESFKQLQKEKNNG